MGLFPLLETEIHFSLKNVSRSTCYLSGAGQVRPVLLSVWKGLIEDTENKCDLEWDEKGGGERDEKCGRMKEN